MYDILTPNAKRNVGGVYIQRVHLLVLARQYQVCIPDTGIASSIIQLHFQTCPKSKSQSLAVGYVSPVHKLLQVYLDFY